MKFIICLLLFFGASCVSTRKYHRTAQAIVDHSQTLIDSIYAASLALHGDTMPKDLRSAVSSEPIKGMLTVASCRHIWVGVEKDTIPEADWHIYHRADTLHVYGKEIACIKCLEMRKQILYSPRVRYQWGPRNGIIPEPKKKP